MSFDEDATAFRRWLVQKVKGSSWSTRHEYTLEKRAHRLGIHPDILEQAQAELDAESGAAGVVAVDVGTGDTHAAQLMKMLTVEMPKPVFEDWGVYCNESPLTPTTIVRSVVHTLLLGSDKPGWVGKGWIYRGQSLKMEGYKYYRDNTKPWPYRARCSVPHGAMDAVKRRARLYGARPTGLLRGAMIELLEGRTQRLVVAHSMNCMFDDPDRYWRPKLG